MIKKLLWLGGMVLVAVGIGGVVATINASTLAANTTILFGGSLGTRFSPSSVTIAQGETVTWEGDLSSHPLGSVDSLWPRQDSGQSFSFTFQQPGMYHFFCHNHAGMEGMVTVTGSQQATATPRPPTPTGTTQQHQLKTFRSDLNGANERPVSVDTPATGAASLTLDTSTNQLAFKLAVKDMPNAITAAHIHTGTQDTTGPILFTLYNGSGSFSPGKPITDTLALTADQVASMTAGGMYINVHTAANPNGEVRGQIFPAMVPGEHTARLSGKDEVPIVDTTATGSLTARLNADQTQLTYTLTVNDLANVTAAHFHRAPIGVNGPIVFLLYSRPDPFTSPLSGVMTMTPGMLNDLVLGDLYVNVHSEAHGAGEIRGQVVGVATRLYLPFVAR